MRIVISLACCVVAISSVLPTGKSGASTVQEQEKYSALAHLPSGAGRAMVGAGATANIDLYIKAYTSDQEARRLAGVLRESGPDALLNQLEKAESIGKITLSGRVGFYDLKLIRSHRTETGRRVIAVGDRPMGFLELYVGNQSTDYPFGILTLELKNDGKKEKGEGSLLYAAKVKVDSGN